MVYVKKNGTVFHEQWCPYTKRLKFKRCVDEDWAVQNGYHECKFCRSVKGLTYKYRKCENLDMEPSYDAIDNALCFKTNAGFWKLIWKEENHQWFLFHLNHGCFWKERDTKEMMRKSFHRQADVQPTTSIGKLVNYIREHDKVLAHTDGDYHKMSRTTKKQKRYYKQAKKRNRRKSINNVYKILDELNQNGSKNERRTANG